MFDAPARRPGRPPGLPKTGGRQKGSGNRLPAELRHFADSRGRALELITDIAAGRKVSVADPEDAGRKIRVYPTMGERAVAARVLVDKLLPDLKSAELSGPGGAPLQVDTGSLPDFEVARRLAFLLAKGVHEQQEAERLISDAAPALPDRVEAAELMLPVGHVEEHGAVTLIVEQRVGDRVRWAARSADGRLLGSSFDREGLLARFTIEETDGDA